jgi:hypothetical protein
MARTCTVVVWSLNGPSLKTAATETVSTGTEAAVTEGAVTGAEASSATSVANVATSPEIAAIGVVRAGTVLTETEAVTEAATVAVIVAATAGVQEAATGRQHIFRNCFGLIN